MKIAIVNDMLFAVEALRRVLTKSADIEVIWVANNGAQAVEQCQSNKPDLILMDLIMPVMDGVEATKQIMQQTPCPILVVTSSIDHNADKVFRAMGAGALDAVNTPVMESENTNDIQNIILEKIKNIALLMQPINTVSFSKKPKQNIDNKSINLVVIGASSGGPQALENVLGKLPRSFPVPIVIVQHVDQAFAPELVSWLDSITELNVKLASENEKLKKGNVYIAARSDHLILNENLLLNYIEGPDEVAFRPSVDVFFDSVTQNWPGKTIGVLLTGMGADGAKGLLQLRKRGDFTITQDKQSSAVYGMPKAAAKLDAAEEILALDDIATRIMQLI